MSFLRIRRYLDALSAHHKRIAGLREPVNDATVKEMLGCLDEGEKLHPTAIAATIGLPYNLQGRWVNMLDELNKAHRQLITTVTCPLPEKRLQHQYWLLALLEDALRLLDSLESELRGDAKQPTGNNAAMAAAAKTTANSINVNRPTDEFLTSKLPDNPAELLARCAALRKRVNGDDYNLRVVAFRGAPSIVERLWQCIRVIAEGEAVPPEPDNVQRITLADYMLMDDETGRTDLEGKIRAFNAAIDLVAEWCNLRKAGLENADAGTGTGTMSQVSTQESPFLLLLKLLDEAVSQSIACHKPGSLDQRIPAILKRPRRFAELCFEAYKVAAAADLDTDDVQKVLNLSEKCLDAIDDKWFPAHTKDGDLTPESAVGFTQSLELYPQAE